MVDSTLTGPTKGRPARDRDRAGWALAILALLVAAVAFIWITGAESRAIARMEPAERRLVYESAFGEFERLCGAGPRGDALEKRCTDQAAYLLKFPECDARCQHVARLHAPRPTK
jgi:hypothetical protein